MTTPSTNQLRRHHPLPVAVAHGMTVCEVGDSTPGTIVGITEAFCIYHLDCLESLCVANWRDIALSSICPASTLLPTDVNENDRRNARATLLRELVGLQRIATLTPTQRATSEELIEFLCGI
ncbi:MAG: hypothetical protein H6822_12870 [Planctomycetaceae bacterium]|nr:hypothetical protein [Planctomycetaceae bacterium]